MAQDFYSRFFENSESKDEKPKEKAPENNGQPTPSPDFTDEERALLEKEAKGAFSRTFGGIALYSVVASFVIFIALLTFKLFMPKLYDALFVDVLGVNLTNAVVQYGIALPLTFLFIKNVPTHRREKKHLPIGEFFVLVLVAEVLMTVGNVIGLIFSSIVGSFIGMESTNTTVEMIEASPISVTLVFAVILAPIAEEFLMRKLLIDRLSKYGEGFAILVSAVTFGLFHGNFYQFFYAALLGIVLGYVYVRGGLVYSIAMHAVINFLGSVLPMLYEKAATLLEAGPATHTATALLMAFSAFYTVFEVAIIIAGAVLLVIKLTKIKKIVSELMPSKVLLPKGRIAKLLFSNAGMIVFLVLSGLTMIGSLYI